MESLTRPATHIVRLLKWGRILARHGALRGIVTQSVEKSFLHVESAGLVVALVTLAGKKPINVRFSIK